MLWHSVEFEDADIRHVVDVGEPGHIGRHRPAADVEEDLVRVEHAVIHADGVRAFEAGMAADERAPVHVVEPGLDALAVVAHDLVLARFDRGHLDTDFACADTVFGRTTRGVGGVRTGDQGLGGNAAVVDARAADELALDHRHRLACLGQSARQGRPGLAGADDDRVEFICHRTWFRRG